MRNFIAALIVASMAALWPGAASAELTAPERTCESFYTQCLARMHKQQMRTSPQAATKGGGEAATPAASTGKAALQPGMCEDALRWSKDHAQWPNLAGMTIGPDNVKCTP